MSTNTKLAEALRLAEALEAFATDTNPNQEAASELRRLDHNNRVLTDALWKACGDDEATVNATIESQGELK